jgi:hypothetical protein
MLCDKSPERRAISSSMMKVTIPAPDLSERLSQRSESPPSDSAGRRWCFILSKERHHSDQTVRFGSVCPVRMRELEASNLSDSQMFFGPRGAAGIPFFTGKAKKATGLEPVCLLVAGVEADPTDGETAGRYGRRADHMQVVSDQLELGSVDAPRIAPKLRRNGDEPSHPPGGYEACDRVLSA